jgi:hypothetical protein
MLLYTLTSFTLLAATAAAHFIVPNDDQDMSGVVVNGISSSTRVKYMRLVCLPSRQALHSRVLTTIRPTKLSSSKAVLVHLPHMALSS